MRHPARSLLVLTVPSSLPFLFYYLTLVLSSPSCPLLLTINHDECMVSFDVISLFTKIPVDVAKTVVLERLKKDDTLDDRSDLILTDIMTALNLCLDNTYLYFHGKFYRRIFGVAIGSPVSVIIANLVMENVEEVAMSIFLNPPKFWRRFVDDTFVIIKKQRLMNFIIILITLKPV